MSCLCLFTILPYGLLLAIISLIYLKFRKITKPLPVPKLDLTEYWGPGSKNNYIENDEIKPFKVNYNESVINHLKQKLNDPITLQPPLEGVEHEYGISSNVLLDLIKYWSDEYLPKWTERQQLLNSVPHFTTQIQGLNIHFIHIKPEPIKGKTIVPMLLLHGWPGSVREFYDLFPLLTKPNDQSDFLFEVIAPSLPGFGWSDGAAKVNFGPLQIATVLRNLMVNRLGHSRFIVQGGDWGSLIGSDLTTLYPEHVIAYHSNFCVIRTPLAIMKEVIASFWKSKFIEKKFESFVFPMGPKFESTMNGTGYLHLQATKPDTIGIVLQSSPIALAAYFHEKFVWALLPNFSKDAVLDDIMIYYLTNCSTTAARLYAEGFCKKNRSIGMPRVQTSVPTGVVRFERDIYHALDWQLQDKYLNIVQSSWYLEGGHFAALESPKLLYSDYVSFIAKVHKLGLLK